MKKFIALFLVLSSIQCGQKAEFKIPKEALKSAFNAQKAFLDKKFDTVLAITANIQKKYPNLIPTLVLKGKVYFYTKKFPKAESAFLEILTKNPNHQEALLWLARIYLINEKTLSKAEKYLKSGINNNSEDFLFHYYLAKVYEKKGMVKLALKEYQRALRAEFELMNIYQGYENLLIKLNIKDRAKKIASKRLAMKKFVKSR